MIIKIKTDKMFTSIKKQVEDYVAAGSQSSGVVIVFSRHSTCGIKILENEILSLNDINTFLNDLVPTSSSYGHNQIHLREVPTNERLNAESHIKYLFFNTSELIPFENNTLLLGQWQDIVVCELDLQREREIYIGVI